MSTNSIKLKELLPHTHTAPPIHTYASEATNSIKSQGIVFWTNMHHQNYLLYCHEATNSIKAQSVVVSGIHCTIIDFCCVINKESSILGESEVRTCSYWNCQLWMYEKIHTVIKVCSVIGNPLLHSLWFSGVYTLLMTTSQNYYSIRRIESLPTIQIEG